MNIATIRVTGVKAQTLMSSLIPAGIVGATVSFDFADPQWEGLTKTAVFQGCVTRDRLITDNTVVIPAETVAQCGPKLMVGVYGVNADNQLVIPTMWATLGSIRDAADPSGDPGTDPELPIWAQLQEEMKDLNESIPPGGKAGQYLRKKSNDDRDVEWADLEIPEQYGLVTYDQDKTITIT